MIALISIPFPDRVQGEGRGNTPCSPFSLALIRRVQSQVNARTARSLRIQTSAESSYCWNRWVWLHFLATINHKRPRKLRNFPWKGCSHIIFIQPKKECRLETILCIQLAFHVHSLATIAYVSARACWPWQGCTQGGPKKLCEKLSPASAYTWMKASPQWANKWRKDKSQGKWYLYTKVWCQPTGQGLFTL